jgi:hypothetical protein
MPDFTVKRIDSRASADEHWFIKRPDDSYVNMSAHAYIYTLPCYYQVLRFLWPGHEDNELFPGLHDMLRFAPRHSMSSEVSRVWLWGADERGMNAREEIMITKV